MDANKKLPLKVSIPSRRLAKLAYYNAVLNSQTFNRHKMQGMTMDATLYGLE